MNTRLLKQQHVGVPTVSCQMPRVGNGAGTVTLSWPDGSSAVVKLTVGKSCRDRRAVNTAGVVLELGAHGLGLNRNVASVQGLMVFIIRSIPCQLRVIGPSRGPKIHRPCLRIEAVG